MASPSAYDGELRRTIHETLYLEQNYDHRGDRAAPGDRVNQQN